MWINNMHTTFRKVNKDCLKDQGTEQRILLFDPDMI
jgi:hypothetical protein